MVGANVAERFTTVDARTKRHRLYPIKTQYDHRGDPLGCARTRPLPIHDNGFHPQQGPTRLADITQ
jgi:hypothetical protein